MKKYNLNPVKKTFDWGTLSVISLGESGRGRREFIVPCPEELGDHVGLAETKRGLPKIINSASPDGGWLANLHGSGCYTRGTYGSVYTPIPERVKVLAMGYGAYGDAGRIGEWNDFLAVVQPETWVYVRPSGGAHKISRYWLYFSTEEVYRVREEEIDAFCELRDIDMPAGDLIDFSTLKNDESC